MSVTLPPETLVDEFNVRFGRETSARWAFLHGGRTNRIWSVSDAEGETLVVKLYGRDRDNPLFPNNHRDEIDILRFLSGTGLAPEPKDAFRTREGDCVVYRHVEAVSGPPNEEEVARALRKLHDLPPPPVNLRKAPDGSAALNRQVDAILSTGPDRHDIAGLKPAGLIPASGKISLLHGDIVPANIVGGADGPVFIDWQCPAMGDPCEDIAIYFSPAMQSLYAVPGVGAPRTDVFWRTYGCPATEIRYRQLAPWFHWRMAAYCSWKARRGDVEYERALPLELAALQKSLIK